MAHQSCFGREWMWYRYFCDCFLLLAPEECKLLFHIDVNAYGFGRFSWWRHIDHVCRLTFLHYLFYMAFKSIQKHSVRGYIIYIVYFVVLIWLAQNIVIKCHSIYKRSFNGAVRILRFEETADNGCQYK